MTTNDVYQSGKDCHFLNDLPIGNFVHTRGIILSHIPYSDHSVIVKAYTLQSGLKSFMIKGFHKKSCPVRPSYLIPLSLLDLVFEDKSRQELFFLKEARPSACVLTISDSILKSSIALFMAEVLQKSIREEEANPVLFSFTENSILLLAATPSGLGLFPVWFMIRLSEFLGFFPLNNYSPSNVYFDPNAGCFSGFRQDSPFNLSDKESELFSALISHFGHSEYQPHISPVANLRWIDILLHYYQIHLPGFGEIKSHRILSEVLHS